MIPPTLAANLDAVARRGLAPKPQFLEFGFACEAPASRRQALSERERHKRQPFSFADRAVFLQVDRMMMGYTPQLRLCITHFLRQFLALLIGRDCSLSGQLVADHTIAATTGGAGTTLSLPSRHSPHSVATSKAPVPAPSHPSKTNTSLPNQPSPDLCL